VSRSISRRDRCRTQANAPKQFGDILTAIGRGELTPDEGNMMGAVIERRANLFQTIELQDEIASSRLARRCMSLTAGVASAKEPHQPWGEAQVRAIYADLP